MSYTNLVYHIVFRTYRYASEIRPSGVTHRATRWVVSLIAEHTVLQVPLEISQCLTLYRTRGCASQNL